MKEETAKRKKNQKRIKKELDIIKSENNISSKLSKQEKNQLLLSAINKKKKAEEVEGNLVIDPLESLITCRKFTCKCGYSVTLYGNTDKNRKLCSKCEDSNY